MVVTLAALLPGVVSGADIARLAAVPPNTAALHAQLAVKLQPSVRLWIDEQSRKLRQAPVDQGALRAAVQARFAGQSLGAGDIETMALLVMMQATKDMDQDLKAVMAEVKAMTAAKAKLRDLVSRVNKDVAQNAGVKDVAPCVPPSCGGYQTAMMEAAAALRHTRTRATLTVREPTNVQQLRALAGDLKGKLDGMNELNDQEMLSLQRLMDQKSKLETMISNVMKAAASTQSAIIQNLK